MVSSFWMRSIEQRIGEAAGTQHRQPGDREQHEGRTSAHLPDQIRRGGVGGVERAGEPDILVEVAGALPELAAGRCRSSDGGR